MAGKPMAAAVRPMNWRRVVETGWRFMVGNKKGMRHFAGKWRWRQRFPLAHGRVRC